MTLDSEHKNRGKKGKSQVPHDAILLSKAVSENLEIKITLIDGEYLIDQLRWHTLDCLGLKSGKVVLKHAIKYWEIDDNNLN